MTHNKMNDKVESYKGGGGVKQCHRSSRPLWPNGSCLIETLPCARGILGVTRVVNAPTAFAGGTNFYNCVLRFQERHLAIPLVGNASKEIRRRLTGTTIVILPSSHLLPAGVLFQTRSGAILERTRDRVVDVISCRTEMGHQFLRAWACASLIVSCSSIFAGSPPDEPPKYCTVYNHFPKSGGSSIINQLLRISRSEGCRDPSHFPGAAATVLDTIHNASVIVGYVETLRMPLQRIGRDCSYFTMMRHPIDRLVSQFFYCPEDHDVQNRPVKWCGGAEGETEPLTSRLVDFARMRWTNPAFRQMMTAFFCTPGADLCETENARSHSSRPKSLSTAEGMEAVDKIKGILSSYTAVGIFEEWSLSMKLFDSAVRSPVRQWDAFVEINRGTQSEGRQALLEWAHTDEDLSNILSIDLVLYEWAVALFENQTSSL